MRSRFTLGPDSLCAIINRYLIPELFLPLVKFEFSSRSREDLKLEQRRDHRTASRSFFRGFHRLRYEQGNPAIESARDKANGQRSYLCSDLPSSTAD